MRKYGALKIFLLVLLVIGVVGGVAGYIFGRKALSDAPALVQQKLKEQGINFTYKSAQLVAMGVGVVFDGLSVRGKVLPYEVVAKQARLGVGFGFSLPPLQLTFNLVEPVITKNENYVATSTKANVAPSAPLPGYVGWALALVQARLKMENGQAEPFGLSGIDALVKLSNLSFDGGKLSGIEVSQEVQIRKVQAIDEQLGGAHLVSSQGKIAYQGKKVVADKLDLTVGDLTSRVSGNYAIDTGIGSGTLEADLTGFEIKQQDLFHKKSGVPASIYLKVRTQEQKVEIEKGTAKFHNLNVTASGNLTTNENTAGQITLNIAPTSLAGWEKFFPKYNSLKTSGSVEGKLDFAGPFKDWQKGTLSVDFKAKDIVLPILKAWVPMKDMDVGGILRMNSVTQASVSNGAIRTLNSDTEIDMKDNHLAYGKAFEKKAGVPMGASFSIASTGSSATVRKGNFVLGSFQTSLSGAVENLAKPRANLAFTSPTTRLTDLMSLSPMAKQNTLTNVSGTIALKGNVTGPLLEKSNPPLVKGDLTLSKVSFDYLIEATKKTVRLKNLSGPISFTNKSVSTRRLAISFPQTDALLDLQVASFDKPNITFNLTASRFNMNDFYETKGKSMGLAPIPVSQAAADKTAKAKQEDFRKNPYLRNTRMNGSVALRNADLGYTKAESVTAKVSYENLDLRIEPVVMKVWGGTITSATRWDGRPALPVSKFTLKTAAVDANQFVGSWSDKAKDILSGRMDTDLNVQFTGLTAEDIKKSTKGAGNFALNDGEIKTMKFSEKPLEALKKIPALSASIQKTAWQEKLNQLAAAFTIEDGRIKLNNPQIKSNSFDLVGSQADIDFDMNITARVAWIPKEGLLASNQLDMLRDDSGRPSIPLAISGPIRSPNITVDMQGVEQRITSYAKRKLEAELKNKVQKELEDKLKGGLQNLFK